MNELEDFWVELESAAMDDESDTENDDVINLIGELRRTHIQLTAATTTSPATAIPTAVAPPVAQPFTRRVKFPPFSGFRDRFHTWQAQFLQFLNAEQPAEEDILQWLRYELCPQLPDEYQTQLQFLRTSDEFLLRLDQLFGNSMAAIVAVKEKLYNLPSCANGKPDGIIKFFNSLQAVDSDLKHLDTVFPEDKQPPSTGVLCFCALEQLRSKLNPESKVSLKRMALREGKYCAPYKEFAFLLEMADDAKNMAHYELMNKHSTPSNHQQTGKEKGTGKTSLKATKSATRKASPRKRTPSPAPRRRSPTPRRHSPSPRRHSPKPRRRPSPSPHRRSPTPDRRQRKIYPCRVCDSCVHTTFKCPALGKDHDLPEKLIKKKVCVRCLRYESKCDDEKNECSGFYIHTKTKEKITTDCYKCVVGGKRLHHYVCGHKTHTEDESSSKKAM